MKKIPTIFMRDPMNRMVVLNEPNPECDWVFAGEGVATRKFDGTCCMIRDGKLFKRYDAKSGKTPPPDFEPAQEPDPISGHRPGWVPVGDGPQDKYHRMGLERLRNDKNPQLPDDGTYELCGPKIQGNPERLSQVLLIRHGGEVLHNMRREFAALRLFLMDRRYEGIVFHHPDGRMAKIKRRDFIY